jgi:hypothetical protein
MISTTAFSSTTKLDQKSKTEIVKQELVSVDVLENVDYDFNVVLATEVNFVEAVSLGSANLFSNDVVLPFTYVGDVGWRYCNRNINYHNKILLPSEPGLVTDKVRIRNDAKA